MTKSQSPDPIPPDVAGRGFCAAQCGKIVMDGPGRPRDVKSAQVSGPMTMRKAEKKSSLSTFMKSTKLKISEGTPDLQEKIVITIFMVSKNKSTNSSVVVTTTGQTFICSARVQLEVGKKYEVMVSPSKGTYLLYHHQGELKPGTFIMSYEESEVQEVAEVSMKLVLGGKIVCTTTNHILVITSSPRNVVYSDNTVYTYGGMSYIPGVKPEMFVCSLVFSFLNDDREIKKNVDTINALMGQLLVLVNFVVSTTHNNQVAFKPTRLSLIMGVEEEDIESKSIKTPTIVWQSENLIIGKIAKIDIE